MLNFLRFVFFSTFQPIAVKRSVHFTYFAHSSIKLIYRRGLQIAKHNCEKNTCHFQNKISITTWKCIQIKASS